MNTPLFIQAFQPRLFSGSSTVRAPRKCLWQSSSNFLIGHNEKITGNGLKGQHISSASWRKND